MTRKRDQKTFLAPAVLMIAAAFALIQAPAGQALDRPDPEAKSALPLPDHDPEATSGGTTVQEIAGDLRGASANHQNEALGAPVQAALEAAIDLADAGADCPASFDGAARNDGIAPNFGHCRHLSHCLKADLPSDPALDVWAFRIADDCVVAVV